MLANGSEKCQSDAVSFRGTSVLQSASFPGRELSSPAAAIQCSFGLSPKFSTPVEKTVEKQGEAPSKAAHWAEK